MHALVTVLFSHWIFDGFSRKTRATETYWLVLVKGGDSSSHTRGLWGFIKGPKDPLKLLPSWPLYSLNQVSTQLHSCRVTHRGLLGIFINSDLKPWLPVYEKDLLSPTCFAYVGSRVQVPGKLYLGPSQSTIVLKFLPYQGNLCFSA